MNKPRGIILLEGADSSGKTTLANYFRERYGARYIHGSLYKDPWLWHVTAIRRAARLAKNELVVIDRNWISHLVYGKIFDNQRYNIGARCLDRALRRYGALTILCVPSDQHDQAARWERNRAAGKREHFNRVREVIALYADLAFGNIARPGDGYLDQLIRFGDFSLRDDVIRYDLDTMGSRLDRFASNALRHLRWLNKAIIPDYGDSLTGRICNRNGVLFIGYGTPDNTKWPNWPWLQRDNEDNGYTFFNRAIHSLALREDSIEYTNIKAGGKFDYESSLLERDRYRKIIVITPFDQLEIEITKIRSPHWAFHDSNETPESYARNYLQKALK